MRPGFGGVGFSRGVDSGAARPSGGAGAEWKRRRIQTLQRGQQRPAVPGRPGHAAGEGVRAPAGSAPGAVGGGGGLAGAEPALLPLLPTPERSWGPAGCLPCLVQNVAVGRNGTSGRAVFGWDSDASPPELAKADCRGAPPTQSPNTWGQEDPAPPASDARCRLLREGEALPTGSGDREVGLPGPWPRDGTGVPLL